MTRLVIPDGVIAAQHAASDPDASAWVSANAGAGKTHVLAQRVIRLLLGGTPPEKILCLTFTKAAAANMANRIFSTLGEWIGFDDAALDAAIQSTGAKAGGAKQRERARRLFAAALDTPGGLKVQTIHGFCTRVLQQFPFEADVAARFRVLEEVEQQQMLEDIRRTVLLEGANTPDSEVGRALATVIPMAHDFAIQDALTEALRERGRIDAWLKAAGGPRGARAQLSAVLGLDPDDTLEQVEAEILDGPHLPSSEWESVAQICAGGSSNDKTRGLALAAAAALSGASRIEKYFTVFFTTDGELRGSIITAGLARLQPDLKQRFEQERARIKALCERRHALIVRDRTIALVTIAAEMIRRYAAEKDRRGQLDYDDLIARTRALLAKDSAISWVHYKLDLGIDHLLIDEAQDTSPEQWEIIQRFAAEFWAGAGARGALKRSIFVVGDDKQSIFSFQGAEPEAFARMHRHFDAVHRKAEQEFRSIPFKYSFRSVETVLDAVDAVFGQETAHKGLTADPVATVHEAVRAGAPGLVELWPLVEPEQRDKIEEWDAPFDTTSETSPRVKLARQVAATVKSWLRRGDLVGADRHPVRAGDILILVRQRGPLFEAIIRCLKNADIAVAGADRLMLTEHIAVMDLLALADAVLLPEDDLALASVLKSPLFGLTEDDLFDLAHERRGSLRAALRMKRPDAGARLDAIAADAKRQTPFAFYAELLGAGGGRKAFLSRLGAESNDALDEFLNLALVYEGRETPSLQGFVAWLRATSAEVKRDLEIARDEVRVMTVHGAKGLEAPIVVLADTTTEPAGPQMHQPRLRGLTGDGDAPAAPERIAWMPNRQNETSPLEAARLRMTEAAENEYRRLLYVAMTRAADRLVVCGATGERGMPKGCWYELVQQGLGATGALVEEDADTGEGKVFRFRRMADSIAVSGVQADNAPARQALPDWLKRDAPAEPARVILRPSDAEADSHAGEGTLRGVDRQRALQRGTMVHRLLQSLPDIPPERRREAALRYVARAGDGFTEAEREEIAAPVLKMLVDLRFAPLFSPGSRAEVSIAGRVGADRIAGQVDRLAVTADSVLIADYKTNRGAPRSLAEACERYPQYIRQIALYRAVLMQLYRDRIVRAALVWTDTADLMEVPASVMDEALTATHR